jgi:Ser/Thr protein kinase RdoA (MazF antagonist)
LNAINDDKAGRVASVKEEIEFALARRDFTQILEKARENNEIPLRVTHNDTKLNNILFDADHGSAICVIDLDTVMPGYAVNDFGDAIRFGANTAAEDETDLSKVKLDLELFEAYTEGFLKGCKGRLTQNEIKLLPIGAMMMTLECGMRFLTDHLNGDVYFKIHRENHNLDRCRNQFALFADMEKKLDQMNSIVKKYY